MVPTWALAYCIPAPSRILGPPIAIRSRAMGGVSLRPQQALQTQRSRPSSTGDSRGGSDPDLLDLAFLTGVTWA